MNISRQIGWGTESNLLYQILKQLTRLTSIMFSLKPKYKVFTALVSQTGYDYPISLYNGELIIGVSYQIKDTGSGFDFTNVGAPNNDDGTWFIATGTTPNSWGDGGQLEYNTAAPVAIILENTIGNVWFKYNSVGDYSLVSNNLFPLYKTAVFGESFFNFSTGTIVTLSTSFFKSNYDSNVKLTSITDISGTPIISDSLLNGVTLEVRVYN